jgi:hypothetical protein
VIEKRMADSEIENAFIAAVPAIAPKFGKIRISILIDQYLHHRTIDLNIVEIPLPLKNGNDPNSRFDMLNLQQRGIGVRIRTVDGNSIEVQAQRR